MSKHPRPTPTSFTRNPAADAWPSDRFMSVVLIVVTVPLIVLLFALDTDEAAGFLTALVVGLMIGVLVGG